MKISKKNIFTAFFLLLLGFIVGNCFLSIFFSIPINQEMSWLTRLNEAMTLFLSSPFQQFSLTSMSNETLKGSGIVALVFLLIYLYVLSGKKNIRLGEEHGSARWGNKNDILPFIDKVFSQNLLFTNTERLTIKTKLKHKEFERNNNVCVVGGAGSGKTRFYVMPNLFQMHCSYVVNDSKGGILRDTGAGFKKAGYKVKVLNLVTLENTDYYNPFHYIQRTEGDCELDILKVVDNLMKNTSDPNKRGGDSFWDDAQKSFLAAVFHLLILKGKPEEQTIGSVSDLVRRARVKDDDEDYISSLDLAFQELQMEMPDCFAVKQYQNFKMAAGKTAKSILISLGVRLSPFDVPSIRKLTSTDTLELDTLGDQKTILYIILPDTSTTINFLASMIYQQLFDTLVYKADHYYNGSLPIAVRCLQDEMANTGQIPDFDKVIATIRSRGISVDIILQNLSQISKKLYKDTWETLVGNCDSFLYLGGNEQSTHKYVSQQLGKETIDTVTFNETRGATGSFTKNSQKLGRNLLDPDEVRKLGGGRCIYMLRGASPFLSDRFRIESHPAYKYFMNAGTNFIYQAPDLKKVKLSGNDPIDFELSINRDIEEFTRNVADVETYFLDEDFEDLTTIEEEL